MTLSPTAMQAAEPGLHVAVYIVAWVLLSNAMILLNKYVLDVAKFPITLTFLHLATTTVLTQLLARFTPLITRPSSPITGRLYLRTILPIGLLYTLSLICANMSYTALPLPNVQILKALAPLATLMLSWVASFTNPQMSKLVTMAVTAISAYYSASHGEATWAIGVCVVGTVAECGRLLIIEKLLREPRPGRFPGAGALPVSLLDEELGERPAAMPADTGAAMSPLVALYYFTPVCAFWSGSLALVFEMGTFRAGNMERVGVVTLGVSCALAFMLNVAGMLVISKTSALTMSILGVLKSPVAILASFLIWDTHLAFEQTMGYGIALAMMVYHGLSADALDPHWQQFDTWFDKFRFSDSGATIRESSVPVFSKATAYLGSLITIQPKDSDVQRGRTARREGTPRTSAEKVGLLFDSPSKAGEAPTPTGKVAGRLD